VCIDWVILRTWSEIEDSVCKAEARPLGSCFRCLTFGIWGPFLVTGMSDGALQRRSGTDTIVMRAHL
jgi:hypothetical protein